MSTLVEELEKVCEFPESVQDTLDELQKTRDVMIFIHLPIVFEMAFKVASSFRIKICVEDLVNAGRLGLDNALDCFIPQIHGQFSTHCLWFIKSPMEDVCRVALLLSMEQLAVKKTL